MVEREAVNLKAEGSNPSDTAPGLAQLVEHLTVDRKVTGSIPVVGKINLELQSDFYNDERKYVMDPTLLVLTGVIVAFVLALPLIVLVVYTLRNRAVRSWS